MAPARLRIVRRSSTPGTSRRVGGCVIAAAAAVAVSSIAAPALAASSGSVQAIVNTAPPPVKSVTLSTNTLTFGGCVTASSPSPGTQLGFPNGRCSAGPVTVTEGTAPTVVALGVTPFSPVDGGTPWTLENQSPTPGPDQFLEVVVPPPTAGVASSPVPLAPTGPDPILNPGGAATAGQTASEAFGLFGPSSSSDPSPQFTQTLTWTAT